MSLIAAVALLPLAFADGQAASRVSDPSDQTLRVVAANDAEVLLRFQRDGQVVATFGGDTAIGLWTTGAEGLCFRWGREPIECWPYERPFVRGQTVTVTSSRGNVVRVTRL
jgi:hypothetical protein